jgi:hypothetical protein
LNWLTIRDHQHHEQFTVKIVTGAMWRLNAFEAFRFFLRLKLGSVDDTDQRVGVGSVFKKVFT